MKQTNYKPVLILYVLVLFFAGSCKEESVKKLPVPDIQVVTMNAEKVPLYKEFVGQVFGFKDIPIRARVDGFLEGIHFEEGREVKKGQKLYTIDSQPFLAQEANQLSNLEEARTYLVNAENELARYKPLAEINAVSKSDLDAAIATKEAAEATVRAAEANLRLARINLGYCTIYSPIDGLIGKTEAREGEYVGKEPNPVILNVVSKIESVRVQFFITEANYLLLSRRINAEKSSDSENSSNQSFELILADGSVYEHKGTFDFIDRNIDASTGSILVQVSFPNPDNLLRPGMFTKVKAQIQLKKDAILVPQRSVTELQGQYSVFVLDEGNTVKARQIKAEDKIGDRWLVREGLKAGDKVVIDGLQKVASGMVINPIPVDFKSQSKD